MTRVGSKKRRLAGLACAGLGLLWTGSAVAAVDCAHPVVSAGQESAISAMMAAAVPASASLLGVEVGQVVRVRWRGDAGEFSYELRPAGGEPVAGPMRTERFGIERVEPCPVSGGAGSGASACSVSAEALAQADAAVLAAVRAHEARVELRCPAQAGRQGAMGDVLRQIDERVRVADLDGAAATLEQFAKAEYERLSPAERLDLALVRLRLGQIDLAKKDLSAMASAMADVAAQVPRDAAERTLLERWAAAQAVLGQPQRGRAMLEACWLAGGACGARPLADALEALGDRASASALVDAWLAATPQPSADQYRARIGLASRANDAAAEVAAAQAAVDRFGQELDLRASLGTALFRAGQHEKAVRVFEGLFERDPTYPNTLGRLSGVLNDMAGKGDHAAWQRLRAEMQTRASGTQADAVALFLHAVSLFYDARFDEAREMLDRVEPLAPREGRVYIYQAMAHLWQGRRDRAAELVGKALETNPHDPDVYYCQSQVLRYTDMAAAARALERYVALSSAPGALEFDKKTHRVEQELAMLRRGEMPPEWDRPGHYSEGESSQWWRSLGPVDLALAGVAVLAVVGLVGWGLRRKRQWGGSNLDDAR